MKRANNSSSDLQSSSSDDEDSYSFSSEEEDCDPHWFIAYPKDVASDGLTNIRRCVTTDEDELRSFMRTVSPYKYQTGTLGDISDMNNSIVLNAVKNAGPVEGEHFDLDYVVMEQRPVTMWKPRALKYHFMVPPFTKSDLQKHIDGWCTWFVGWTNPSETTTTHIPHWHSHLLYYKPRDVIKWD